jgi:hypothetical protein
MWVRSLDCGLVAMIVGRCSLLVAINPVPTAVPVAINVVPQVPLIAIRGISYCEPLHLKEVGEGQEIEKHNF